MKVNEITVSVGQTIQVAQYSPRNYHVSYKVELEDGDDRDKIVKAVREKLTKEVEDYFKEEQDLTKAPF